jgi:hypothetical protein
VPGVVGFGCCRQGTSRKITSDNKQNAGNRDPRSNQIPRSAVSNRLKRPNVRPTRNGPDFMRKFGEYVFLEDSRYARQAKSACALPLGARALA